MAFPFNKVGQLPPNLILKVGQLPPKLILAVTHH
jgi:hypothetical protein